MAKQFFTPTDKAGTFARLKCVIYALYETTITTDRREWFNNSLEEFRYLLTIAAAYNFNEYESMVINHGADAFNEGQLFYMGATIAAPSLHYGE
jgi:hypothetical protein